MNVQNGIQAAAAYVQGNIHVHGQHDVRIVFVGSAFVLVGACFLAVVHARKRPYPAHARKPVRAGIQRYGGDFVAYRKRMRNRSASDGIVFHQSVFGRHFQGGVARSVGVFPAVYGKRYRIALRREYRVDFDFRKSVHERVVDGEGGCI